MKKKILFMITTMDVGGVEKSLLSLLAVLPKEKYDITVMFLYKQGDFLTEIPDWVKIQEAKDWYESVWTLVSEPPPKIFRNYFKNKHYIKAFRFGLAYFLSRELKNRTIFYKHIYKRVDKNPEQYDIAIAYQGPTEMIDYYIINKVNAKKKISWVHFDVSKHHIDQGLYEKLYWKFDKIYVVSQEAGKRLTEKIPNITEKTEVFLNIVSKSLINKLSEASVEFDEDYQGIRIVTVGRIAGEKGQDIAVKVLSRLRNDGYEVRWYCVGGIEYKVEYEKVMGLVKQHQLSDHFILLGPKLNPYPYIARSDLYVQPSRHEGYCIALAEARCLNKPIIATDFIGSYEQITDGETGYIVQTNVDELYEKIKFLLDNPLLQEKFRANLLKMEIDTKAEVNKLINYV